MWCFRTERILRKGYRVIFMSSSSCAFCLRWIKMEAWITANFVNCASRPPQKSSIRECQFRIHLLMWRYSPWRQFTILSSWYKLYQGLPASFQQLGKIWPAYDLLFSFIGSVLRRNIDRSATSCHTVQSSRFKKRIISNIVLILPFFSFFWRSWRWKKKKDNRKERKESKDNRKELGADWLSATQLKDSIHRLYRLYRCRRFF